MGYGKIDHDYGMRMATMPPEDDGPVLMLNFMRYRETAEYDTPGADQEPTISGRDADDRYAPVDVLRQIGARVAFLADVIESGDDGWHRIGVVRYPTRRAFVEMQSRPDFQEKHVHKKAGMEFTVVLGTVPLGPPSGAPDDSGIARIVAWPEGTGPTSVDDGILLHVDGRIIGDERTWDRVSVHYGEGERPTGDGVMAVTVRISQDRLAPIATTWPH